MKTNSKKIAQGLAAAALVCGFVECYVTSASADGCFASSSSWTAYVCCTSAAGRTGCSVGNSSGSSMYVEAWGDLVEETGCAGLPYHWVGSGKDSNGNDVCSVSTTGSTVSSPACLSGGTYTTINFLPPVC